jgi:hypothetical protein
MPTLFSRARSPPVWSSSTAHLRAETTPDAIVPVLVLDVTEEADKLATSYAKTRPENVTRM